MNTDRVLEDIFDAVTYLQAQGSRRGSSVRIDRLEREVSEVIAIHHALIAKGFEEHEGKRIDVAPRSDLPKAIVELLGRPVRRRKNANLTDCLGARSHRQRVVAKNFGDAKVKNLERCSVPRVGEIKIAWVHVAMDHALSMGVGDGVDCGIEERDRFAERSTAFSSGATLVEVFGERLSVEPLEHHVRHQREHGGCHGGPARNAAHNLEVPLRQSIVKATLVAKAPHEVLDDGGAKRAW